MIADNYKRFMNDPTILRFVERNGRVFIATEGRSAELIAALYRLGHRFFSEKYVQESAMKWSRLKAEYPDVTINFFGSSQRNKLRKLVRLFDVIESVDRPSVAHVLRRILNEESPASMRYFLVQLNVGREPQKRGVSPEGAQDLIDLCLDLGLPLRGLMAIPPQSEDPAPHYQRLRRLADLNGLAECHMGMSGDFRKAIEAGATAIRVGQAIFTNTGAWGEP